MQQNLTNPIREARLRKRLTQEALASRLGVTKATISGWETGRDKPDSSRLNALGEALRPHLNLREYLRTIAQPVAIAANETVGEGA